jgi:hypothetical protein
MPSRSGSAPNALVAPPTPTTVGEQLAWATRVLETIGLPAPAREAAVLLASVIGSPGIALDHASGASLTARQVDAFLAAVVRRTRNEPPRP